MVFHSTNVIFLCLLGMFLIYPSASQEDDDMSIETLTEWVEGILEDVNAIDKIGTVGRLFAFKPRAYPIVLGETDLDSVLVAAELGQGRILAVAQDSYQIDFFWSDRPYGCMSDDDLRGETLTPNLDITINGYTCQAWNQQTPHAHTLADVDFAPETVDDAGNNCRNPGITPKDSPWCYTTDPDQEFDLCRFQTCSEPLSDMNHLHNNIKSWLTNGTYVSPDIEAQCFLESIEDLSCLDDPNVKIVVWTSSAEYTTLESETKMAEWIKEGGGLFYAIELHDWFIAEGDARVWTELPFYQILLEAGIGFDLEPAKDVSGQYSADVTSTKIERLYHLTMPNALDLVNIDALESPLVDLDCIDPYIQRIVEILETETDKAFPMDMRKEIGRQLVPFLEEYESQMEWPACDGDKALYVSPTRKQVLSLYTSLGFLGLWKELPNFNLFPGDHDERPTPRPKVTTVTIESTREDFWPTGHYLLAGDEMTIEVLSTDDDSWKEFTVMIGIHTDNLGEEKYLYRYPRISTKIPLWNPNLTTVTSPFGGSVILLSPTGQDASISVELGGVVSVPSCSVEKPFSFVAWAEFRMSPPPMSELNGKYITFYLPKRAAATIFKPKPVLEFWDNIVKQDYELAGIPESDERRMFFVTDLQPSYGLTHEGYPIVANSYYFADPMKRTWPMRFIEPSIHWNIYHEIGHNVQRAEWTFDGFFEVTADIFTLYNIDTVTEVDPLEANNHWYKRSSNDMTLVDVVEWKDFSLLESGNNPGVALLLHAQLYREFGWQCYWKVFRSYENDRQHDAYALPDLANNREKMEQWVRRWSDTVEYNLCPLFQFWAYPVDDVCDDITHDPYLPTDDITAKVELSARVAELVGDYTSLLRTLASKPDCS